MPKIIATAGDGQTREFWPEQYAAACQWLNTVQRGTGAGEATVRVEQVNRASRGSVTQQYVHAVWRRFDFNGSAADTQADTGDPVKGWWNVRGGDVYSAAAEHGWNAAVSEFQRGTAGSNEPQLAALYRDGHWHFATRTFQITEVQGGIAPWRRGSSEWG